MHRPFTLFALASLSLLLVQARLPDGRTHGNMPPRPIVEAREPLPVAPVTSRNGTQLPPLNTTYYFDQLIDHNNPNLGTFKQRYWFSYQFYEPGGPIFLYSPGEGNAAPSITHLTNKKIAGFAAERLNGSIVVLEHRYYGLSNPFNDLSAASLKYHTIQQAIDDLEYFVNNVKLPMPGGDQVTPDKAPWIMVGASYAGALTGWTMINKPDLFFAGYGSSATVQSIIDFWQYFEPIRQYMPQNCSADVQAVIAHVDQIFTNGTKEEIQDLKNNWGLGALDHVDDVAGALRNNLWDWQQLSVVSSGPGTLFYNFCDALEVKNGVSAGAEGWGLDNALQAWGKHWNDTYYNILCGDQDAPTCLGTYDPTQAYWTDTTVDNWSRSWMWIVCNQVGFFFDGAPQNQPTLVSRLMVPSYDTRQCPYWFPDAFNEAPTPQVDALNAAYGGWDLNANRLFLVNGKRDPWKDATVSSEFHTRNSSATQPIVLTDGFHGSDINIPSGQVDKTVGDAQNAGVAQLQKWLAEWSPTNASSTKLKSREALAYTGKPVSAKFGRQLGVID